MWGGKCGDGSVCGVGEGGAEEDEELHQSQLGVEVIVGVSLRVEVGRRVRYEVQKPSSTWHYMTPCVWPGACIAGGEGDRDD